MILDTFFQIIFFPVYALLDIVPSIDISIPSGIFDGLKNIASGIGYVLPVSHVLVIIGIKFILRNVSTIWTIVLKIKSFIPTMGD